MNCNRVRLKLMDFHEDKLDRKTAVQVKNHLSNCAQCHGFAKELGQFQNIFIVKEKPKLNPFLTNRIMDEIAREPAVVSQIPSFQIPGLAKIAAVALLALIGLWGGLELGDRITSGLVASPVGYSEMSSLVNEMNHEPLEMMLLNLKETDK